MLKFEYKAYRLQFKFEAGTSRGKLNEHSIFLLKVHDSDCPVMYGYGEAAPLERLSPESMEDVEEELKMLRSTIQQYQLPETQEKVYDLVDKLVSEDLPSLRFGLQTALLDLLQGGKRLIFDNDFYSDKIRIPINGLIWMGDPAFMKEQIDEKLESGFRCLKIKIAALKFDKELEILEYIRSRSEEVIIRVDANGGFAVSEVLAKLNQLAKFNIHSIEQPIMPRQPEALQLICRKSPIPVALDEELIGIHSIHDKKELLKNIQPAYLVLKPTLTGGLKSISEWIACAQEQGIGWWITSALESNIGLNAICQFTAGFDPANHQGLGTGQLYHNNFSSPLQISGEFIHYDLQSSWSLPF